MSARNPSDMSQEERLDAVAGLFAKAVVRHRRQRRTSLDVQPEKSLTVTTVSNPVDDRRRE